MSIAGYFAEWEAALSFIDPGSTIGGLMDCITTLTSMALQYSVPLQALMKKFSHQRFEPSGSTRNPNIRQASSIIDYVFRRMAFEFLPESPKRTTSQTPNANSKSPDWSRK